MLHMYSQLKRVAINCRCGTRFVREVPVAVMDPMCNGIYLISGEMLGPDAPLKKECIVKVVPSAALIQCQNCSREFNILGGTVRNVTDGNSVAKPLHKTTTVPRPKATEQFQDVTYDPQSIN